MIVKEKVTGPENPLGGVNVSVLDIRPEVSGFKPGRGDGILRMKINSTPSFRRKVKPGAPCRKTFRYVKVTCKF
jgi:hypothetical protein